MSARASHRSKERRRSRLIRALFTLGVVGVTVTLAMALYTPRPIRSIQAAATGYVRDYLAVRRAKRYKEVLEAAAAESGVAPEFLAAIMVAESSGDVDAVSRAGAMGLFQLSRVTATWRAQELGIPEPSDEELLSDPLLNARLGADNIAWLLRTYDGDERRALCAYNAGARKLKLLCQAQGGWEPWLAKQEREGDSQILAYADRVLRYRDQFLARGVFEERGGESDREEEQ